MNNFKKIIIMKIVIFIFSISIGYSFQTDERFQNTTMKGNYGEELTDQFMKARGYESLPSKHTGNQGIDHVFIKKYPNGEIDEIRLVETKTDGSPYTNKQMDEPKIKNQIEKMKNSADPEVRKTAAIIEKNMDKVKCELWRHDTVKHKTKVYELDKNGNAIEKADFNSDKAQKRLKNEWNKKGNYNSKYQQLKTKPSIKPKNRVPIAKNKIIMPPGRNPFPPGGVIIAGTAASLFTALALPELIIIGSVSYVTFRSCEMIEEYIFN